MSSSEHTEGAPNGAKHILIIEDDASIALGLRLNLEADGYRISVAHDGESGLKAVRARRPDLVLLDLMLPRMNGFELLRALRSEPVHVPTIILSARDAETDIVMGLDLGAEDYVTKPFGLAELLARIKAVLRREAATSTQSPLAAPSVRVFGELAVDPGARSVTRSGKPVALTATEFDVLWFLIESEGRALTRSQIQSRVWGPGHHGTVRTIDNFLMQLRTKLEEDPSSPKHLLTVRGIGYRFCASGAEEST